MPIYEYRCGSCGHQQEFLQKVSDPQLTECPECKKPTFSKMLSAAGFQLKGSGWYATDFKNKSSSPAPAKKDKEGGGGGTEGKGEGGSKEAAAAPSCGTGCACH